MPQEEGLFDSRAEEMKYQEMEQGEKRSNPTERAQRCDVVMVWPPRASGASMHERPS